jgi:hypothetical protein
MKADQPPREEHGDEVEDLVGKRPTERAEHELEHVGRRGHGEREPDTLSRQDGWLRHLWAAREPSFEIRDRAGEHFTVGGRAGGRKIGSRAGEGELDRSLSACSLALFGRRLSARRLPARSLRLLRFDVFALEPSGHEAALTILVAGREVHYS